MRCGTIGSCQSAATSEIDLCKSDSCKWHYSKCPDLLEIVYKQLHMGIKQNAVLLRNTKFF